MFNTFQHFSTLFNTFQHSSTLFNTLQHFEHLSGSSERFLLRYPSQNNSSIPIFETYESEQFNLIPNIPEHSENSNPNPTVPLSVSVRGKICHVEKFVHMTDFHVEKSSKLQTVMRKNSPHEKCEDNL